MIIIIIFFFFNDTATTEIYTLSLHDALPISPRSCPPRASASAPGFVAPGPQSSPDNRFGPGRCAAFARWKGPAPSTPQRSEEHTSELQSRQYLVCRLLLEKKKKNINHNIYTS